MSTFSFKLPDHLYRWLDAEAKRRNLTKSALVREMIDQALQANDRAAPASCAELAGDLVGAFRSGRRDLGSDDELLEEALSSPPEVREAGHHAPECPAKNPLPPHP